MDPVWEAGKLTCRWGGPCALVLWTVWVGPLGGGLAGESEVRGGRGLGLEGFGGVGVFVEAGGVVFVLMFVKISGL